VTAAALLISWLVSVYFVPYIGTLLLKSKPHAAGDQPHELFDTPFYTRFRSLVNWCVQHRWITIGLTIGTLVLGLVGMGKVQNQFFPDSSRLESGKNWFWTLPIPTRPSTRVPIVRPIVIQRCCTHQFTRLRKRV